MYKTGDYGSIKGGLLFYEGRRDTQIKIRGNRVDITEVEKNVNELDYVAASALLVYHAEKTDQALVAFVSVKNNVAKTPFEVETDLKSYLPPYMIPRVLVIEEFPFLSSGKIDRQKLLKMFEQINGGIRRKSELHLVSLDETKNKSKMAKEVFDIIAKALDTELRGVVSAESNFFELGGSSMNTVYTVQKLSEKGYYIKLTDFIKSKNLGEVLKKITKKKVRPSQISNITERPLTLEPLDEIEKEECLELIAQCFFHKSDMDKFLTGLKIEHYKEIINKMWDKLVELGCSFKVKDDQGNIIGVSLAFDLMDEPEVGELEGNVLITIFEFLDFVERPLM